MEKQTKNLGHVTAYGYAKSQGYTGTEEEYAELMASYATVAERAETAAESAEESAREVKDVIPEVTAQDNGKVMMVENGEWGAGEVDVLPTVTSQDNGKVLGVVEGQWAKTEPEDGLPEVTSSDNGKVLSVVEGSWAPAEAGSGLPEVTSEDNGDILSVVNGAWAKSEPGYRVENETVIAAEQSVTTVLEEQGNVGHITATVPDPLPDSINVTFDGTSYENVPKHTDASLGVEVYGDIAFSEYPFVIVLLPGIADLLTQSAGTYTIAITAQITTVTLDDDFKLAVNSSYMEPTVTQEIFWAAQSITTEAVSGQSYAAADGPAFDYDSPVPEKLNVVFDGTAYELPNIPMQIAYGEVTYEGSPDFTTYPLFLIAVDNGSYAKLQLRTPQAGTYTLKATYDVSTTVPTEKFKEAVHGVVSPGVWFEVRASDNVTINSQTEAVPLECTTEDIWAAISRGQNLYFNARVAVDGGTNSDFAKCPLYVAEFDNTGFFYADGDLTLFGDRSIATVNVAISNDGANCFYREVTFS